MKLVLLRDDDSVMPSRHGRTGMRRSMANVTNMMPPGAIANEDGIPSIAISDEEEEESEDE